MAETMLGLSAATHEKLKLLKEEGHFGHMVDAYRFGIALALVSGVEISGRPESRTTVFAVDTVDPSGSLQTAIRALCALPIEMPVLFAAEGLAEWGVQELARLAEQGELDVARTIGEARRLHGKPTSPE